MGCNDTSTPASTSLDTAITPDHNGMPAGNKTPSNTENTGTYDSLSGCYRYVYNRDTIKLTITIKDTVVNGLLAYDNYQIDGSTGTIKGVVRNNQIIAYYDFTSEGMQSVREVAFKIENRNLIQADTRDMSYRNDTAVYKNYQQIQFDTSRIFQPVDCRAL
jgi:hypothetical protein